MIGDAIASALGQSYRNLEVLVVDNASTDNTADVVRPFLSDPRLKYIRNESNLGLFGNFNRCIEASNGDLIHILHSDDMIEKDFTRACVTFFLQYPEVYLTFGSAKLVQDDRVVTELRYSDSDVVIRPPDGFRQLLARRNFIICPTVMARRELYEAVGRYPVDLPYSADYALWLKAARRFPLGYVRDAVLHYRQGEHSESFRLLFSSPDGYFDMIRIYLSAQKDLGKRAASFNNELNLALWRSAKDCLYAAATRGGNSSGRPGISPSMFIGCAISTWSMIRPISLPSIIKKYSQIVCIVVFSVLVVIPGIRSALRMLIRREVQY